jgi:outer membrane putative beta-barrel porin/alpha-amylase
VSGNALGRWSIFLSLITPASFCGATDESQKKSRYNLFHPTPDNLLRELATDRPDKTESPTTVDAGHFQIEMDFATFTQDQMNGVSAKTWNIAPFNLRVGLLNDVELSLVFESYVQEDTEDKTAKKMSVFSGVGNFITRLKVNLWGNDGGRTAFAFFPFMKFPTSSGGLNNNSIEGGAIFPFSMTLPAKFELGMETGVVVLRNESNANYHEEFVNSITFAREIAGKLSGYCEFFSSVSTECDSSWIGTADFGLTYALTENVQIDCGCNIGVTDAADDINAFSGLSVRF